MTLSPALHHTPLTTFQIGIYSHVLLSSAQYLRSLVCYGKMQRKIEIMWASKTHLRELDFDAEQMRTVIYLWYFRGSIYSISLKIISNKFVNSKHFWCFYTAWNHWKVMQHFRSCGQVMIDITLHTRKIEITCKIATKFLNSPCLYILYFPPETICLTSII